MRKARTTTSRERSDEKEETLSSHVDEQIVVRFRRHRGVTIHYFVYSFIRSFYAAFFYLFFTLVLSLLLLHLFRSTRNIERNPSPRNSRAQSNTPERNERAPMTLNSQSTATWLIRLTKGRAGRTAR